METAIIGLSASGKTTIFNALTGQPPSAADVPGGKKQTKLADVKVPDERIDRLSALFKPKKTTYATMLFRDLALEYGQDASISPASLADVRRADAIVLVVRSFESGLVTHPLEKLDPVRDLRKVLDALIFADYEITEKRVARVEKEGKKDAREVHALSRIAERLGSGALLGTGFLSPDEAKIFAGFGFLTTKPIFVLNNTGEKSVDPAALQKEAADRGLSVFPVRGDMEMEIAQLAPEDQKDFLADLGIKEPAKNRFLRTVYATLDLQSFFTTGEDEVRAWTIKKGTTAVKAAGVIHTDLEKGFIRAEVIPWNELLDLGGYQQAKKSGKVRLEGKEYVVQDGDALLVRFNV